MFVRNTPANAPVDGKLPKAIQKKNSPLKLIKIRFTSWRDTATAPRSPQLQQRLDAWITRLSALSAAAVHMKEEQAHGDSKILRSALARVAADLEKIDAERALLLSVERAETEAGTREAREHKKAGTFGYRVFSDAGNQIPKIVDESGNDLPPDAVYTFEEVDTDPPLPEWAKDGKFER